VSPNGEWHRRQNHISLRERTSRLVTGKRLVCLAPKGARLTLGLSVLLFALAVERRLFAKGLDKLLTGEDVFLDVNPLVVEEAMFVAADTKGESAHGVLSTASMPN